MFQPVQRWVGGGIYTPNLITSFQKCPSGPQEGQEVTTGVFGNFPRLDISTWILPPGSRVFCPSGTFGSGPWQASCGAVFIVRHSWVARRTRRFLSWPSRVWLRTVLGTSGFRDVRRPLATAFDKLRGTSPSSSFASALPEASRRFRAPSSGAEPRRALRCFIIFEEPSGWCFVIFAEASAYPWGTFGTPSCHATFGRRRSPTPGRQPHTDANRVWCYGAFKFRLVFK